MGYDFENNKPIYLQIIEHIKNMIITRKLLPDQKIPSVRELSVMFEVNPNTVQKALGELEEAGLIYTERTNGKFVTKDEEYIHSQLQDTINERVEKFCLEMEELGLSREDIIKSIKGEK